MAKKRLMVVEDDFDVAEMLSAYFQSHDFEVFHAEDGSQGVEMALSHFPNVIVLDVELPYQDGYEVCLQLRQKALTKYIPIIFLTQRDKRADRVHGLELGADDYITKPFDVEELRLRVEGSIRRATRASLHEIRTGLPTGTLVENEIEQRKAQAQPFAELHLAIEGYSAYRDVYGFIAADEAFGFAGHCIQEVISEKGSSRDFVGVQEDHFVVLTAGDTASQIEAAIEDRFSEAIKAFYKFMDVDRGAVILESGSAQEKAAPLMHFQSLQAKV